MKILHEAELKMNLESYQAHCQVCKFAFETNIFVTRATDGVMVKYNCFDKDIKGLHKNVAGAFACSCPGCGRPVVLEKVDS